ALQQADQVLRGVAAAAVRLGIGAEELLFGDVAVVALQALLGHQLNAVIRRLLALLAVLPRRIIPLVDRALGTAPEILAQTAVDLEFRLYAFAHYSVLIRRAKGRQPRQPSAQECRTLR